MLQYFRGPLFLILKIVLLLHSQITMGPCHGKCREIDEFIVKLQWIHKKVYGGDHFDHFGRNLTPFDHIWMCDDCMWMVNWCLGEG